MTIPGVPAQELSLELIAASSPHPGLRMVAHTALAKIHVLHAEVERLRADLDEARAALSAERP